MNPELIIVEGFAPADENHLHLRDHALSIALDQRAFGPRRLLVGLGSAEGKLLVLAHAPRTDPVDLALEACLSECGHGAQTAVAFCDEPVEPSQPTVEIRRRLEDARAVAAWFGIHLVDWVSCDDLQLRFCSGNDPMTDDWWVTPATTPPLARSIRLPRLQRIGGDGTLPFPFVESSPDLVADLRRGRRSLRRRRGGPSTRDRRRARGQGRRGGEDDAHRDPPWR